MTEPDEPLARLMNFALASTEKALSRPRPSRETIQGMSSRDYVADMWMDRDIEAGLDRSNQSNTEGNA